MAHAQLGRIKDVTPSDATELDFDWVYISGAGTLRIIYKDGSVTDLAAPLVGIPLPFENGKFVNASGTTATGIMVV